MSFEKKYRTRLIKGNNEPIYLPADDEISSYRILFPKLLS
ncbi:MAG: elongation factor P hydroxylase [Arsenophonus sp. NC-QC1-MAG3]